MSHNSIFILNGLEKNFLLYTQIKYYDFLVTMHLLFLVFVIGSPLFVRGYSYDKVTGIVKCPDGSFNSEFNVTELNNTTFTKVDRTKLLSYKGNPSNYHRFTTSCTTNVTDMTEMFLELGTFNHSISTWDTSSVISMKRMFSGATTFNQDISNWTTSNVESMNRMFRDATSFNQDISNWTTSSVINMYSMFYGATSFNHSISNWTTSNVTNMARMFYEATSFNQDISNWVTSSVINMYSMFYGATSFNHSISNWTTSSVTDMAFMFGGATSFNQDISNWTTSNVYYMQGMFRGATFFNQDISTWDMSSVNRLDFMFYNATSFNQSLTNWCVNGKFLNGTYTVMDEQGFPVTFYSTSNFSTHSPMIDAFQPLWNGAGCICDPPFFGPYCVNSYDETTGTVKCPHPTSVGESFFVPALNTSFTKVNRTMLDNYRDNNNFENFTTSCTTDVEDMSEMFAKQAFNHDISTWDTSSVTNMYAMFDNAQLFNSDISKWDTSSVLYMTSMFNGALKFNQSLTNWCVRIPLKPYKFATNSLIQHNTAFLPLWNGTGCTNKCYNGIRNTSDYSCICVDEFIGIYCDEGTTTTLTSTLTTTSSSTLTSTLTSTSSSTLTTTSSSTLTTTYTSIEEDRSANSINVNVIIGLVSGGVVLVGFVFFVFCLF